jgi:hypothetical protein
LKKSSLSESSSDIMELEEGILLGQHEPTTPATACTPASALAPALLAKKQNCNTTAATANRCNNNINAVSIETDV